MDELVAEFISEASESLLKLDSELVELESNPENYDLLSKIFRVMHTIKGTCGFLSLNKLAAVAHATENILDQMRNKKLQITSQNITIILESLDIIKSIIENIQNNGAEPSTDYTNHINKINLCINGEDQIIKVEKQELEKQKTQVAVVEEHNESNANQTVRVKVEVLDYLMQMISELVLNRNQLLQLDRVIRNNNLTSSLQNLTVLTTSLQEAIMGTRMQPIGNAWIKMPRIVRDLGKELSKKIKLEMIGQDTELDKQLIEALKDPLMHMVRNSADHGLEKEADRLAAGKPAEGTITLKAYHSNGSIVMEISDDGYGLNIPKIKNKILEKSLATEEELAVLSDEQIMQYIFKAGFSTADHITSVSGRGVGMDVVRNNIDSIRGNVEIKSTLGKGSTFIITIPLTLAIIPILIVEAKGLKFGLPQANILEMLGVNENYQYKVEEINNHLILRLRDDLLPLIKLSEILKLSEAELGDEYYIVICEVNGVRFGLIVDNIYDTEEIVLKPMSAVLKSIVTYSGITLLGNGEIITILNANEVAKQINPQNIESLKTSKNEIIESSTSILSSFLLVKSGKEYQAIPLELISRIEEIDIANIENINGKKIIQHNNSLMYIESLSPEYRLPKKGKQLVIIIDNNEHVLGLAVEKIVEIVKQNIETSLNLEENNMTSLILAGKATNIIDVNSFFDRLFFTSPSLINTDNNKYKILLIDDSPYFRKLISSLIKAEGFDVYSAKDSVEAKNLFQEREMIFDIVIIDHNMPNDFKNFVKDIPIIALTERKEFEKNAAVHSYISKSNHSELIEVIDSLIREKNNDK